MKREEKMKPYARSLLRLARAYRVAEAEIVRAYFRQQRKPGDHLRWLKAQAFKEYSAIKPLLTGLAVLYPHVDKNVDRHHYKQLGEKLADEAKHATLIMDLIEAISGQKLAPDDLLWLPEDKRLAKIRAHYSKTFAGFLHGSETISTKEVMRKGEELERAAITLTEGGGGALYEVCRNLNRNRLEKKIASAFAQIYSDEMRHKNMGAQELARWVRSKKDYRRAAQIIRRVSEQRLRMRNEQFAFPLSQTKITELEQRLNRIPLE
jgi:hypothetical protein